MELKLHAALDRHVKFADPDDCWVWLGRRGPKGYGRVSIDGRYQLAHRVSWEVTHGPIPEGLVLCHSCDNPPCVNPRHLTPGTIDDNIQDMKSKGRARFFGSRAGAPTRDKMVFEPLDESAVLTLEDVRGELSF